MAATQSFPYTGPVVSIPDGADLSGTLPGAQVGAPVMVSSLTGNIVSVTLRIDGTVCSSVAGATTVGIDHTFVNDLQVTLRSPDGTDVLVIDKTDGSGNNFCQVTLDDASAGPSIQTAITAQNPFIGSWKPNAPLSAFVGQNPNGQWQLLAQDFYAQDTGNIRTFTITITTQDSQTITFPAQSPASYPFVAGGTFAISPVATASSGLPVSYSSLTTDRCTVAGTTVTMVAAGTCTLAADQDGDTSYAAATQATQNLQIAVVSAVAMPVPALGAWGLSLLGLLAAGLGLRRLRR